MAPPIKTVLKEFSPFEPAAAGTGAKNMNTSYEIGVLQKIMVLGWLAVKVLPLKYQS